MGISGKRFAAKNTQTGIGILRSRVQPALGEKIISDCIYIYDCSRIPEKGPGTSRHEHGAKNCIVGKNYHHLLMQYANKFAGLEIDESDSIITLEAKKARRIGKAMLTHQQSETGRESIPESCSVRIKAIESLRNTIDSEEIIKLWKIKNVFLYGGDIRIKRTAHTLKANTTTWHYIFPQNIINCLHQEDVPDMTEFLWETQIDEV